MPTRRADAFRRDQYPWTTDQPFRDRVAQRHIQGSFAAKVTHGCEARRERSLRERDCFVSGERQLRFQLLQSACIVRLRIVGA